MGLFDKGVPQDLQDIMDARERRWIRQQEILASQKKTLICYKLNIPGEIKNNKKIKKLFDEGLNYILQNLKSNKISIEYLDITNEDSGSEAYITVDETPQKTKLHMCYLEDNLGIGRLMDIDVLNTEGTSISRKDFGLPSRKCLLCPKDAFECARNRTHSVEDLQEKIVEIYNGYFVAGKRKKR